MMVTIVNSRHRSQSRRRDGKVVRAQQAVSGITPANFKSGKQQSPQRLYKSDTEMVTRQFSRQQNGIVHGD